MGTTSIWSTMGHYYTAMCLVPIQASTLEVVDQGIAILRLLEGLLRRAEIVGGIAKKGGDCWRDCYIGLCVRLTQEAKRSRVAHPLPYVVVGRTLSTSSLAATSVLGLGGAMVDARG